VEGQLCYSGAMFSAIDSRYYLIVGHSFPTIPSLHVVFLLKTPFIYLVVRRRIGRSYL